MLGRNSTHHLQRLDALLIHLIAGLGGLFEADVDGLEQSLCAVAKAESLQNRAAS